METIITNTVLASCAIVRAARANPAITVEGLQRELECGDIDGWMQIARRYKLTLAQWSDAMQRAINHLSNAA